MNDLAPRMVWQWPDGCDDLQISEGRHGVVLFGRHGPARYRVEADHRFVTTSVEVAMEEDGADPRVMTLDRDAKGWRLRGGDPVPGSAGALDPDIACTAATNTLPIRRLGLAVGATAEIDVLYIAMPDLTPRILRQRYSRRDEGYLYENLESGFSAFLTVDSGGWVTDYPGVCRRVDRPK